MNSSSAPPDAISPISINSILPPEILNHIFEDVYEEHHRAYGIEFPELPSDEEQDDGSVVVLDPDYNDRTVRIEDVSQAALRPSFFPYGLAAVCPYWEEILSTNPTFWRTVVLFLDTKPTPVEKAAEYFRWSGNLPIDVFVTRRWEFRSMLELYLIQETQTNLVLRYMQALVPHLHRCRILHVDVTASTSLPVLPSRLPTTTSALRYLALHCDLSVNLVNADGNVLTHYFNLSASLLDRSENQSDSVYPFTPRLETLAIDGKNFQFASREPDNWLVHQKYLRRLGVADYAPVLTLESSSGQLKNDAHSCDECGLALESLLDLAEMSWRLDTLSLRTLTFKPPSTEGPAQSQDGVYDFDLSHISDLVFDKMEPDAIQMFFEQCYTDNDERGYCYRFERCPRLHEAKLPFFHRLDIILWRLDADVDLKSVVRPWRGKFLTIEDCASCSDAFLDFLGNLDDNYNKGRSARQIFNCHELQSIEFCFSESAPFSPEALRRMIESRGKHVNYADEDWKQKALENWPGAPALYEIRVTGSLPALSKEDGKWFDQHLIHFSWGLSEE